MSDIAGEMLKLAQEARAAARVMANAPTRQKNAALEFQKYLLSKAVQEKAVGYGLRPVNADVTVDQPNSPFTKWKDAGITPVVQRTSAMRSPDRDVLQALLRWFDLNVAQR